MVTLPTIPTIPTIDKKFLIKWTPVFALLLAFAAYFIPIEIGTRAYIGLGFGLAGRALFPYWIKWKESAEELPFNYSYLMPIIIATLVAVVIGLPGLPEYITLVAAQEGWADHYIYLAALFVGYMGAEGVNKVKGIRSFFESSWEEKMKLLMLVLPIDSVEEPAEETPVSPPPTTVETV